MSNKIIGVVVGTVVSILLIATVLMPAISLAEHSGAESHENGSNYMSLVGNNKTAELILTNQNAIYSDGNLIEGHTYIAFASDVGFIYYGNGAINIFWVDQGEGKWSAMKGANISIDGSTKTIEITDISHASSNDNLASDELTLTYTEDCYYRTLTGDYTSMTNDNVASACVMDENQITAVGHSGTTYFYAEGTAAIVNGTPSQTAATVTLTDSDPEEFKTFTVKYTTITPTGYIVPAKIWTEGIMDSGSISMIAILPLLMIAGLLIFAVSGLILSRD